MPICTGRELFDRSVVLRFVQKLNLANLIVLHAIENSKLAGLAHSQPSGKQLKSF